MCNAYMSLGPGRVLHKTHRKSSGLSSVDCKAMPRRIELKLNKTPVATPLAIAIAMKATVI